MPDGSFMPGAMADAASKDGHTHKGYSDCTMCSAVAAMAGLSASVIATLPAPRVYAVAKGGISAPSYLWASSPASYSSRAPPILIG